MPRDPTAKLWWTLRRPFRPLTLLNRANALLGANWTLHVLRHTAAYRMARDPKPALTDVQWVLGHAHLSTTQIYVPAGRDEIVEAVRAHHVRQERPARLPTVPAAGYRAQSLRGTTMPRLASRAARRQCGIPVRCRTRRFPCARTGSSGPYRWPAAFVVPWSPLPLHAAGSR